MVTNHGMNSGHESSGQCPWGGVDSGLGVNGKVVGSGCVSFVVRAAQLLLLALQLSYLLVSSSLFFAPLDPTLRPRDATTAEQ